MVLRSVAIAVLALGVVLGAAVLAGCGEGRGDGEPGKRALAFGLSGERPEALSDPRFRALGLRRARVVVSWDLADRGERSGAEPDAGRFPGLADEHLRLLAWLRAAKASSIDDVLIAVRSSRDRP